MYKLTFEQVAASPTLGAHPVGAELVVQELNAEHEELLRVGACSVQELPEIEEAMAAPAAAAKESKPERGAPKASKTTKKKAAKKKATKTRANVQAEGGGDGASD